MYIMQVVFQIFMVTDDMIPKTTLPKFHVFFGENTRKRFVSLREIGLERMHNLAKVTFARRLNNQVKVIRQKHVSNHIEWMQSLYVSQGLFEQFENIRIVKNRISPLDYLCNRHYQYKPPSHQARQEVF